jgi:type IV pilus assembly protein PilA
MFIQKLRERIGSRLRGEDSGFTLVELLVVMLILGILAAIAIPSFFNQRDKGNDAQAKADVRTAQTAIETYATDNDGAYTGATIGSLRTIEPTLNDVADADFSLTAGADSYEVGVRSSAGQTFTIERLSTGVVDYDCSPRTTGGCPTDGNWGS